MPERLDVAVVGAGPFGLSVAAHLTGQRVRVFGEPMHTWRTLMPPDMLLRSAWEETSLSAPEDRGSIDEWAAAEREPRRQPIPLQAFLRYSEWFRQRFVPDVDEDDVVRVEPTGDRYRLATSAGEEVEAARLVLAVGAAPFAYVPPPFEQPLAPGVSLAGAQSDFSALRGCRLLVVGAGQGGLEAAALAATAGAEVEIVTRSGVRWFADKEPDNPRGPLRRWLYRLAYPAVGYGPPPLNRIVIRPDLMAALPAPVRERATHRALRAGGSPWVRGPVTERVRVTEGVTVTACERRAGGLVLSLSDGSQREVDEVVLATGYRFSLDRLSFLAPELAGRIATRRGWPVLDRFFRATDPGIAIVGYAAEGRFGPMARFVLGTGFTACRLAQALGR